MDLYEVIRKALEAAPDGLGYTELCKTINVDKGVYDCLNEHRDEFRKGGNKYHYIKESFRAEEILKENCDFEYKTDDETIPVEELADYEIAAQNEQVEAPSLSQETEEVFPEFKRKKLSRITYISKEQNKPQFSNEEILNRRIINKNGEIGVIIKVSDNQSACHTIIEVDFGNRTTSYVYPSCFMEGYLSFANPEEEILIQQDVENFLFNSKEEIEKRNEKEKNRINTINYLQEHLSCIEKHKTIEAFCNEYKKSIVQEIIYLKQEGQKKHLIYNGVLVTIANGKHVYLFETESELNLQPDFNINVFVNDRISVYGKVIACEENTIMFSSERLYSDLLKATKISFDAWFLLEELQKRLDELKEKSNSILQELVCKEPRILKDTELKFGQKAASEMARSNPITFIWGPPGTGKTYTLSNIAKCFIKEGKRILMLSYSNVSVDAATKKVASQIGDYKPGTIVRYGYPKDKELLNDETLTSFNIAVNMNPELQEEQKKLINAKKMIEKKSPRYKEIQERLQKIRIKIRDDETELVKNALFVATTLSKAVCDKYIYQQEFDVVIIDEASMAYTPQIIFAASLAKQHFCCIGDFNQLPPIVQNKNNNSLLRADVYEYCGDINNLVLLDVQYRMHKSIASFISHNMYADLLESASETKKREVITKLSPYENKPVVFVDVGDAGSATKLVGSSHVNLISALIISEITKKVVQNTQITIGIITPYSEQAKLINSLLSISLHSDEKERVICATVHQFQGSERDVIIYDATDSKGEINHPGALLSSNQFNLSNRLFNVAMTRAKSKFIAVGDKEFLCNNLPKGIVSGTTASVFYKLIRKEINIKGVVSPETLPENENTDFGRRYNCLKSSKEGLIQYTEDVKAASDNVRVDISVKAPVDYIRKAYLPLSERLKNKGVSFSVNVDKYINNRIKPLYFVNKKPFVLYNLTVIDDEIIWIGNPFAENEICWRIQSKSFVTKVNSLLKETKRAKRE